MALKFYNTESRKKEAFKPIKAGQVSIYSCGPTVYNYAHIGNWRAYVFADLPHRYLKWKGFKLKHVMNITDVEDKIIRDSIKEGKGIKEFTEKYTKIFFEDMRTLNVEKLEFYPKATDNIDGIVKIVQALIEKGYAYKSNDGIYFSISKFKDYGKMAHLDMEGLKAGARVRQDEYDKEHAQDFALWKFWDRADGDVFWDTPLGKGRPGWHIECSAMSMRYLGPSLDIHTGGVDLIFPHHQNEIAQSEAATGKKFVKYWMHNEHLMVDGQKMSKSLGNFYTLRDLVKKGHDPMAIRYLLLASHYRQKLNLTDESLKSAAQSLERIREFASRSASGNDGSGIGTIVKKAKSGFESAMDDDLNTPLALSVVFDFIREANSDGAGRKAYETLLCFDEVLGLNLSNESGWKAAGEAAAEIRKLIEEREKFRKSRSWKEADRMRDALKKKGILVEDTSNGPAWKSG